MIYFLRAEQQSDSVDAGWIKIGTTTRLSVRLKQIAVDIGHTPTVLAVLDGAFAEEHALHKRFGFARMSGEWFYPGFELLQLIETEGRPWDGEDEALVTASVKLSADVVQLAQFVAALENTPMTDLLSNLLRPILAKREDEAFARRSKIRDKGGAET
jgi:hypothetical protein